MRVRGWLWLLAVLFLSCAHTQPTGEQAAQNSGISGQVVDESGAPLAEVDIQVEDVRGTARQALFTDSGGRFQLSYLLDAGGQRRPLQRGVQVRISAWRAGMTPREELVRYPGGWLVLQPVILAPEALDVPADAIPSLSDIPAGGIAPESINRSSRGE